MKKPDWLFVTESGDGMDSRKPWGSSMLRPGYEVAHREINNTLQLRSTLRVRYTFPGAYEIFYITSDGGLLCHDCVLANYRSVSDEVRSGHGSGWRVVGTVLDNEMDGPSECSHCNRPVNDEEAEARHHMEKMLEMVQRQYRLLYMTMAAQAAAGIHFHVYAQEGDYYIASKPMDEAHRCALRNVHEHSERNALRLFAETEFPRAWRGLISVV